VPDLNLDLVETEQHLKYKCI